MCVNSSSPSPHTFSLDPLWQGSVRHPLCREPNQHRQNMFALGQSERPEHSVQHHLSVLPSFFLAPHKIPNTLVEPHFLLFLSQ